jgi:PDDEXK-like uncharacterized protein DUF3799
MMQRKVIEPGIYTDMSNEEYHASAGISRSAIMEYKRSAKHYWNRYINPDYKAKEPSKEMIFGSAFHKFMLEHDTFFKEYFVSKKNPHHGSSTAGKYWKEQMLKDAEGKIVLDEEDYDKIIKMSHQLYGDSQSKELILGAQYEVSIFWEDPGTGLLCKARPDILHENFVVDLKTTKDASFHFFQKDFYYDGYYLQMAMIKDAIAAIKQKNIDCFVDLAIEKVEPYAYAIYTIEDEAIEYGRKEYKYYLKEIKDSINEKNFPSYPVLSLGLPSWVHTEEFENDE